MFWFVASSQPDFCKSLSAVEKCERKGKKIKTQEREKTKKKKKRKNDENITFRECWVYLGGVRGRRVCILRLSSPSPSGCPPLVLLLPTSWGWAGSEQLDMQGSTFLCTRIRSFSTRSAVIRIDYFVDCFLVPRTSGVQLSCISISTLKTKDTKRIIFVIDAHFSLSCVFTFVK